MNNDADERYLFELKHDRERIAVRRAFVPQLVTVLLADLVNGLGLGSPNFWAILEFHMPLGDGEIDVILGSLSFTAGRLDWPPRIGSLAAVAAKAGYLDETGVDPQVKSLKAGQGKGRRLEGHLNYLLNQGIERVALLEIFGTEPSVSDSDGEAWILAAGKGGIAHEKARPIVTQRPLPDPIGHWIFGWGSVAGKLEHEAGAGGANRIRPCGHNASLGDVEVRKSKGVLTDRLSQLFAALPVPSYLMLPYVTVYCKECRSLHLLSHEGTIGPCGP